MTELEQYKIDELFKSIYDLQQWCIALSILIGLIILGALFLFAFNLWADK